MYTGEEEPGKAEPLVAREGSCVGELVTRIHVEVAVLPLPAVTLNGIMSPVEETSNSDSAGVPAVVPVVYRNVKLGVLDPDGGGA
jgi:hypothetical protein